MSLDIAMTNRSQLTGRFNFARTATGDVAFDETQAHAVITSVAEDLNGYWADPNHGSNIGKLKSLTALTPSQAEASTLDSLSTLESQQLITKVTATATAQRDHNRLTTKVGWSTPDGVPQSQVVET